MIRVIKVTGVNQGENGQSSYRSNYVEGRDYVDGDRHGVIGPITVIRVEEGFRKARGSLFRLSCFSIFHSAFLFPLSIVPFPLFTIHPSLFQPSASYLTSFTLNLSLLIPLPMFTFHVPIFHFHFPHSCLLVNLYILFFHSRFNGPASNENPLKSVFYFLYWQ